MRSFNEAKLGILGANWLRVPGFALTTALERIIKAFENTCPPLEGYSDGIDKS